MKKKTLRLVIRLGLLLVLPVLWVTPALSQQTDDKILLSPEETAELSRKLGLTSFSSWKRNTARAGDERVATILGTKVLIALPVSPDEVVAAFDRNGRGYSVCIGVGDSRPYINCGETGCPVGETFISYNPGSHPSCQSASEPTKIDCGQHWSGWVNVGHGPGNMCPPGCWRGRQVGIDLRVVGFPPRPQAKYKHQCWRSQ